MKRIAILLAVSSFFLPTLLVAGEQYLCIADKVSGFSFNNVSMDWENATFNGGSKFVISKPDDANVAFVVHEVGKSAVTATCGSGFDELGSLSCTGYGGDFRFNRKSGRFINSYVAGYYNIIPGVNSLTDRNSDTPSIEIGKCSPF